MDAIETLPDELVMDARAAFERYRYAFEHDLLIQGGWHGERGGRHIACVLGALGRSVTSPDDCPAQVMPRWLAHFVPNVFDRLPFDQAKAWGLALYEQLARLGGQVPFSVVYDWQAASVLEFWAGSLKKRKFDAETLATKLAQVERLQALHRKHLEGGAAPRDEWREALRPVFRGAYANAYANADAYAYADAYADAYAEPSAPALGETKWDHRERRRAENLKLLADGLVEALKRVPTPETPA